MKSLKVAVLIAGISANAFGSWDAPNNPDRHASFALNFSNGELNGNGVSTEYLFSPGLDSNVPVEDKTANTINLWSVAPSLRFPMTDQLTIDFGLTYQHQEYDYAGPLTRFHGSLHGEIYSLGFRYYFVD